MARPLLLVGYVALVYGSLHGLLAVLAVVAAVGRPNAVVGAQEQPVYEPRVEQALRLLDESSATTHVRGVLDSNRVSVNFLPVGPGVYARYSVARHVIEVDSRWVDSDQITLAAVIAHEGTHTQDAVSGYLSSGGASACIDSEVRAFRNSALFWLDHYGPGGKAEPVNELERQLNSIAQRQVDDPQGLEALVRQTYTQQCGH